MILLPSIAPAAATAPAIDIAELVLPVSSVAAAEHVTVSLNAEVAALYALDRAAGLDWSGGASDLTLDLDADLPPEQIGRWIARQLRNRLVRADRIGGAAP